MLTVETACRVLEELGCSEDPIVVKGITTTPSSLEYSECATEPANRLKVAYYREGSKRVNGTLTGMVKERLR